MSNFLHSKFSKMRWIWGMSRTDQRLWKTQHFSLFLRGFEIMYIFVVSRNINMFSKQKMFKINNSFDGERFEVRSVQCTRYILYHIFIILRKKHNFLLLSGAILWNICFKKKDQVIFFIICIKGKTSAYVCIL